MAICLDNLASVEEWLGNYHQARHYYDESLALSHQLGNYSQVVLSLNNLGALVLHTGSRVEAEKLLSDGLQLSRKTGMQRMTPFLLANLGLSAYKVKNYVKAESLYQNALSLAQESGQKWLEAWLMAELDKTDFTLGVYWRAQGRLNQSSKLAKELKDVPLLLHVLFYLAELHAKQGKSERTINLLSLVIQNQATEQEDKDLAGKLLKDLQEHIPLETIAKAREWGRTANLEEVVEEVLQQLEAEAPPESSAS